MVIKCKWLLNIATKLNGFEITWLEFIPFLIIVKDKNDKKLINHEKIHQAQMLETLFIGYYIIYIGHYLYLRFKYKHKKAYENICFEEEAFEYDDDLNYLKKRKRYSWFKFLRGF